MKYLKVKQNKQLLLSEYLNNKDLDYRGCIFTEEDRIDRTKYLISVLGDILLEKDMYELFIKQFQVVGGKYNVRIKPETIKGIYEFIKRYPFLTVKSIDEIWNRYIEDLFVQYDLINILDNFFIKFGFNDMAFCEFIDYLDKISYENQNKFKEESLSTIELIEEYGENFVYHIKDLIVREHYSYEQIKKYLPSSELIKKDEEHLRNISNSSRILIDCCEPISYILFDRLLEDGNLDSCKEILSYNIGKYGKENATFTKTEFLESLNNKKILKLN